MTATRIFAWTGQVADLGRALRVTAQHPGRAAAREQVLEQLALEGQAFDMGYVAR